MKTYTLFARSRGGELTTSSTAYYSSGRSNPVMYEVRAASIKQAYYLAGNEIWAGGPKETGLLKLKERQASGWERASYLEEREAGVG